MGITKLVLANIDKQGYYLRRQIVNVWVSNNLEIWFNNLHADFQFDKYPTHWV